MSPGWGSICFYVLNCEVSGWTQSHGTASGNQQEARQTLKAAEGQWAPGESSLPQLLWGRCSRENKQRGRAMRTGEGNKPRPGCSVIWLPGASLPWNGRESLGKFLNILWAWAPFLQNEKVGLLTSGQCMSQLLFQSMRTPAFWTRGWRALMSGIVQLWRRNFSWEKGPKVPPKWVAQIIRVTKLVTTIPTTWEKYGPQTSNRG